MYIRETQNIPSGYQQGWNVRYTTDLTDAVWFYLRGEEYSAQLDHFVRCIEENGRQCERQFVRRGNDDGSGDRDDDCRRGKRPVTYIGYYAAANAEKKDGPILRQPLSAKLTGQSDFDWGEKWNVCCLVIISFLA